ncbi:tyrosine-type recombinase/integrase, partial [Candidatus Methylomirabilis sp.]|uniref:tyrosine-type recombinase/integrase n=1 Tax=Candidatus Methylomirabilis sp. TaxID=2032687 RepID=UPI003C70CF43
QERLDVLMAATEGDYLFAMRNGVKFDNNSFTKYIWRKAFEMSGVKYRRPYALRHTHAAWALAIGVDPNRLAFRMGHGSKQMVFEVYGSYILGVEKDKNRIREYFGEDFA